MVKHFRTIILFTTSAAILTIIQPPFNFPFLAWVALVPFILACQPENKFGFSLIIAYLVSLCYWLGNLYWIEHVTLPGWLAFCVYIAFLWPLLVLAFRFCIKSKIPLFLAAGVLFVAAERLQGLFLGGFYWRFLAHSQYKNITLIQIADLFGSAGISFLIAMVNGLIAGLIISARRQNILKAGNLFKAITVLVVLTAALLYGSWRVSQSSQCIEQGPLVGSVQSNVPQTVKDSGMVLSDEVIFQDAIKASKDAAQAGAKLIVWPETMVQAVLDKKVLSLLGPSSIHRTFDDALKQHAKDTAYVLVGATGGVPHVQSDGRINLDRYNSAFLYTPDGRQADQHYNKIHLVPFGEVVPFKKAAPWLHRLLMNFTPYDFDYSLEYGDDYTVFTIDDINGPYRFGVMICYEDTIPEIARNFCIDSNGLKQLDWLVNISNDGWFVRFTDGGIFPSTELAQHAAVCVFRAIENRIAVLRSVNTGISCLIDSVGQIRDGFEAGTLPHRAMRRTGMAGWFVDKVPIDKRVTFFSRFGQLLDILCVICFILAILLHLFGRFFLADNFKGRFNEK